MKVTKQKRAEIERFTKIAVTLYKKHRSTRKVSAMMAKRGIIRAHSWVALKAKEAGIL